MPLKIQPYMFLSLDKDDKDFDIMKHVKIVACSAVTKKAYPSHCLAALKSVHLSFCLLSHSLLPECALPVAYVQY